MHNTLLPLTAVLLLGASLLGQAAENNQPASVAQGAPAETAASSANTASAPGDFDDDAADSQADKRVLTPRRGHHHTHGSTATSVVSVGHNSSLASGENADSVVSVFGSSTSAGQAVDVVSVVGDTKVTGPVADSSVAVLGSNYVDSKVDGDVVAVLGNVELGPHAEIGGDVVTVLGHVRRDPAAIVHGGVQKIFTGDLDSFDWLRVWVLHCAMYARPLAAVPGLGWAWSLALGFLAFYVGLALVFREPLQRCVRTLETQPGPTLLAALIAMLLSPVLITLLCITLIGIAAVPFAVGGFLCLALFGKAVTLAWLGERVGGGFTTAAIQPALAVLLGGSIVTVLYLVPVLGFLVYNLLGILGFGAVVYTLILAFRAHQATKAAAVGGPAASGPASTGAAAAGAFSAAAPAPGAASPGPVPVPGSTGPDPTAPRIDASLPRAGFGIRMAALLVDVLLVGFAMSVLSHGTHLHLIVLATYGALMWKLRGATVGGIIFDLQVVRVDGRQVDWETAIVRALGCFLSLAVAGLGFIWIAFDDGRQGWHDKIAGTAVVRIPKAPAQPQVR